VKFYHFTESRHLPRIREEGLVPSCRAFGFEGDLDIPTPPYFPIVRLTQTQVKTAAGVFVETVVKDVRIKIELPIKTKELWHWATWLERHDPDYLRLLMADETSNHPGWVYYWFSTGIISPDRFRSIDADTSPVVEISDEQRQERLARLARNSRLIRIMVGQPSDPDISSHRVSKSKTKPSKIRFAPTTESNHD
jgi:hypothetical protein